MTCEFPDNPKRRNPQPNPGKNGIHRPNAAKMASIGLTSPMINKPNQSFKSDKNHGHIDCSPNANNIMTNGRPYPFSLYSLWQAMSMTNEPDQSFNSNTNMDQSFNSNTNMGNIRFNPNAANIMDNRSILFTWKFFAILFTTIFIIWLWKFKK